MTSKTITKRQLEELFEEAQNAREIVKEITMFGVNDRQKIIIIQSLAMTLEDNDAMRAILDCVTDVAGDKINISKMFGE